MTCAKTRLFNAPGPTALSDVGPPGVAQEKPAAPATAPAKPAGVGKLLVWGTILGAAGWLFLGTLKVK